MKGADSARCSICSTAGSEARKERIQPGAPSVRLQGQWHERSGLSQVFHLSNCRVSGTKGADSARCSICSTAGSVAQKERIQPGVPSVQLQSQWHERSGFSQVLHLFDCRVSGTKGADSVATSVPDDCHLMEAPGIPQTHVDHTLTTHGMSFSGCHERECSQGHVMCAWDVCVNVHVGACVS